MRASPLTFASILFLLALAIAAVMASRADAAAMPFGAPVALSVNGHASDASVAIDDTGHALAVWADGALFYSDHPHGKTWSAAATVFGGSGAGFVAPVKVSALGAATIVTYGNLYGIYALDRAPGGRWSAPALLVAAPDLVTPLPTGAPPVIFLENAAGDAAIVYEQYSGGTVIHVVRRPFGGAWSAPETVATSATSGAITLAGATIGAAGDVLVTWETFQVSCSRSCHDNNFVVHASREPVAGQGWADSGALSPMGSAYVTASAIAPTGGAVTLFQPSFSTTITSRRQAAAGAAWSAPATAYTAVGAEAMVWGAEASPLGRVSFLAGYGGVWDVDGSVGSSAWRTPVDLARADSPAAAPEIAFGASAQGGLSLAWVDIDGSMRAAQRPSAVSAWTPVQTLAPGSACDIGGVVCTGPAAAGIDDHGHAAVLYFRLDPTVTYSTLYAATN